MLAFSSNILLPRRGSECVLSINSAAFEVIVSRGSYDTAQCPIQMICKSIVCWPFGSIVGAFYLFRLKSYVLSSYSSFQPSLATLSVLLPLPVITKQLQFEKLLPLSPGISGVHNLRTGRKTKLLHLYETNNHRVDAANVLSWETWDMSRSVLWSKWPVKLIKGRGKRMEHSLVKQLDANRECVERPNRDGSTVWILSSWQIKDRAEFLGHESVVESLSSPFNSFFVLLCMYSGFQSLLLYVTQLLGKSELAIIADLQFLSIIRDWIDETEKAIQMIFLTAI